MEELLLDKYEKLKQYIASFPSLALAFSGGVDSTFLLYAAREALGDQVIAVTVSSLAFPQRELKEAEDFCRSLGVRQYVIAVDQMQIPGFSENPVDRCYLCKRELFQRIGEAAKEQGITDIAEGTNLDDEGDFRPGMKAIAELGVTSPLRKIGFTKREIRRLSAYLKLPTSEKPSFACLATRFPYGDTITPEKIRMIDQAEQELLRLGFRQFRVRLHGDVARIELEPSDFDRIMEEEIRTRVYRAFKDYGFSYVALDLLGYRTGSMNEKCDDSQLI